MNIDEIDILTESVREALQEAADTQNTLHFLNRILTQAVLTHGGELRVDPSLSEQAKAEKRRLEFGDGGVRLV